MTLAGVFARLWVLFAQSIWAGFDECKENPSERACEVTAVGSESRLLKKAAMSFGTCKISRNA